MKISLPILFSFFIYFTSCDKNFLDKEPSNQATNELTFTTISGIKSALTGCYNDLQSHYYYGRNLYLMTELYSDNAKLSEKSVGHLSSFYNYSVTTDNDELKNLWQIGYKIITNTNNIIQACDSINFNSIIEKNNILGEAYAIRSLVYFDLVRIFSQNYLLPKESNIPLADGQGGTLGIPLILMPNESDSIYNPASVSVNKIYKQIITDLLHADVLLEKQAISPYRLHKYSVKSLLAITYLHKNNLDSALLFANQIIESNQYSLVSNSDYISSWGKDYTSESILSISMLPNDNPRTNSIGNMLSPYSYGGVVPSNDLINLYSNNDIQYKFLEKQEEQFYIKYPTKNNILGLNSIPVIRLSEIYLILSEVYAKKGANFYSGAETNANIIATRNNMYAPITIEKNTDISKIYDIYRKEFAFEGKRFFQLKRTNQNITRTDCNLTQCEIKKQSYLFTFPIPQAELNANKNLSQNYGY